MELNEWLTQCKRFVGHTINRFSVYGFSFTSTPSLYLQNRQGPGNGIPILPVFSNPTAWIEASNLSGFVDQEQIWVQLLGMLERTANVGSVERSSAVILPEKCHLKQQ